MAKLSKEEMKQVLENHRKQRQQAETEVKKEDDELEHVNQLAQATREFQKKLSDAVERALDRHHMARWDWMSKDTCPRTGIMRLTCNGVDQIIGFDINIGWYAKIGSSEGMGDSPVKAWERALADWNRMTKEVRRLKSYED